jgi:hypothetical protein
MRLLTLTDFETLIDLVLSTSARPSTGERAFVPTSGELPEYIEKTKGPTDRMLCAYHSGQAVTDDDLTVLKPEALAELAMDAGLVKQARRLGRGKQAVKTANFIQHSLTSGFRSLLLSLNKFYG